MQELFSQTLGAECGNYFYTILYCFVIIYYLLLIQKRSKDRKISLSCDAVKSCSLYLSPKMKSIKHLWAPVNC